MHRTAPFGRPSSRVRQRPYRPARSTPPSARLNLARPVQHWYSRCLSFSPAVVCLYLPAYFPAQPGARICSPEPDIAPRDASGGPGSNPRPQAWEASRHIAYMPCKSNIFAARAEARCSAGTANPAQHHQSGQNDSSCLEKALIAGSAPDRVTSAPRRPPRQRGGRLSDGPPDRGALALKGRGACVPAAARSPPRARPG
jgi:hypothetical protein